MKKKLLSLILAVCIILPQLGVTATASGVTVQKAASAITLDGAAKSIEGYEIYGSNYFKLRDVAYILSGTPKQFEVTYDAEKKAISIITNKPYTPVGGEMTPTADGEKTATLVETPIYIDGDKVKLTTYNIDGSNYFKLRDLGIALDFDVDYDEITKAILISSDKDYTIEIVQLTGDDFEYYINDGDSDNIHVFLLEYKGSSHEAVRLPSQIEGYPVRIISPTPEGRGIFKDEHGVTFLYVPNTITAVYEGGLSRISTLKKVVFEDSSGYDQNGNLIDGLYLLERYSFNECINLFDIYLGNAIKNISPLAFDDCTSLTKITFPASVEELPSVFFSSEEYDERNFLHITLEGEVWSTIEYIGPDGFSKFYKTLEPGVYVRPDTNSLFTKQQ